MKRVLITAPKSGSGKTLFTCGLIEVLKRRQLHIASLKCGPDYIDPMFHRNVLGVPSGNIDTFFTDKETTRRLLARKLVSSDVTIMEGVMGYYDGLGGESIIGSTYDVARTTETPAILVIDGKGSSVSLAALIQGMMRFREDSNIHGVILNRVSVGYYERIKQVIERECGVKVLGFLPDMKELVVPSRHLGLIQPQEMREFQNWIHQVADAVEKYIDVDAVLEIAGSAMELVALQKELQEKDKRLINQTRIAVARDEAFSFYYEENLQLLQELGAELVSFSPMHDKKLPDDIQGLLLGGGYPENYARELSENQSMRESIFGALNNGLPCLGECGGFLYLQQTLEGADGQVYPMVGALDGNGFRTPKLCRFGYMMAEKTGIESGNIGVKECYTLRGHEFHYWDCTENGDTFTTWKPAVIVDDNGGDCIGGKDQARSVYECMVRKNNILAGFPHFYYYSEPRFVEEFLELCEKYKY